MPQPHRQRSRAPHTKVAAQPLVCVEPITSAALHPVLQHSWQSPPFANLALAPYHGHTARMPPSVSYHSRCPSCSAERTTLQHSQLPVSKIRPQNLPCHDGTSPHTRSQATPHTRPYARRPPQMIMQSSTNKTNNQNTKLTRPARAHYIATARTPPCTGSHASPRPVLRYHSS